MRVSLGDVEAVVRAAWGPETAFAREGYLDRAPELEGAGRGQCGATAMVIQDLFGGELVMAEVTVEGVQDGVHYWNRFGGLDVDLTAGQFAAEEIVGAGRVVTRPADGLKPGRGRDAYELLRARVFGELRGLGAVGLPAVEGGQ
jgi:hypothetical protein